MNLFAGGCDTSHTDHNEHHIGEPIMITVREQLLAQADTNAERELLSLWMDEDREGLCARQRAWQRLEARHQPATLRFNW